MKILIKIVCLCLLLFSNYQMSAQTFGAYAGLDLVEPVSLDVFLDPIDSDYQYDPIYKLGPTMDVQLSTRMIFTTGLLGGYRSNYSIKERPKGGQVIGFKTKTISAEIPLLFRITTYAKKFRFFGQFGPSLTSEVISSYNVDDSINSKKENRSFSWLEIGSQIGLGVESDLFRFGIDYKVNKLTFNSKGQFENLFSKFGIYTVFKFNKPKKNNKIST